MRISFRLIVFAAATLALRGQSTFGSLVGTATDASGGALAQSHIRLQNLDDNAVRESTTGDDGAYQFLNLKPGRYQLTGSHPGFADAASPAVELTARQQLRVDLALAVAAVSTEVEVSSQVAMINTESGTVADVKNFQQLTGLPVNYRGATTSPLAALATVPGTQQDANGNVSVGGAMPSQVQYSVDGVSTVNVRQNGALPNMNPSSELIAEFRVTQFNNNAEFSQVGDVSIVTKSGGNTPHGSLFEYLQNSAFDASPYGFDSKAHKVYHTFGGSLSGPVLLPRLYRGRDRTFFFVDYEGNRRRFATPQQYSVPTAAMRAGDLNGLPGGDTIDPTTGAPFSGNRIPLSRINPVARNLLSGYVPTPNYGNDADTNANYRRLTPTPADTNGYDVRVDHMLSTRHQLYLRWSAKNLDTSVANALLPTEQVVESDRNLIASYNWSIRPTLINELRFGWSRFQSRVQFPLSGETAVSSLGLQGLDLSDVHGVNAFPSFNYADGTGFTAIGRDKTGVTRSLTTQIVDSLSWVRGKHTLKFGGDWRRLSYGDLESFGGSNDFGAFTFSAGAFSGNAFSDLLLGLPSKSYVAQSGPDTRLHTAQTGLYAQDEFHITSRLVLNFGLRWQALPPFVSEFGNLTAFDPATGGAIIPDGGARRAGFLTAINACPGVNPALPCTPIESPAKLGLGDGLRYLYKANFQPRFSFAWRPTNGAKTAVRGGFGIFTITNLGQLSFNTTNINVSVVRTTPNALANGSPLWQFPAVGVPDNPLTIAGTQDFYQNVALHYRDPQAAQWNFTVERELPESLSLRVSYVGMNQYRLSQTVDLNQTPSSSTPYDPANRPYRNWGRLLSSENAGFNNYQALQWELNHASRHGLTFQLSHTWAKSLGNVSGDAPSAFSPEVIYGTSVADRFNLGLLRGNTPGIRRNRVLLTALYNLPFGKSRIAGGWQMSTVTLWQSGSFLTPTISPNSDQANLDLLNRGSVLRPDRIGDGNLASPTPDRWFDISAFTPTPAGAARVGNAGVGILSGPSTLAISAGVSKQVLIGERVRARLEATFTNLPNHSNFAAPSVDVSTPATFGKATAVQTAEGAGNRTGQLALRFEF